MNKKWEYKIISMTLGGGSVVKNVPGDQLNAEFTKLGDEGWEFVESQRIDSADYIVETNTTAMIIFIFRREKA